MRELLIGLSVVEFVGIIALLCFCADRLAVCDFSRDADRARMALGELRFASRSALILVVLFIVTAILGWPS